jgi:hypothetical protein
MYFPAMADTRVSQGEDTPLPRRNLLVRFDPDGCGTPDQRKRLGVGMAADIGLRP